MKRSSTGDFKKNKKLCLSSSPTHSSDNNNNSINSNSNNNNNNNSMTNITEQIKDMVLHLDRGDLDFCISQTSPTNSSIDNNENEDDISIALHKALKNIAQRQLKLETENKRYQIAIKQQHHLLTQQQQQNQSQKDESDQEQEEKESVVNISNGTPEDCISSFRQSPMLEKLQLSPTTGKFHFCMFLFL
jgi:hypothetical protein